MVIKLNTKQKDLVMDFLSEDKGIGELVKYFYTCSRNEIKSMDIEINDMVGPNWKGWWNLVVEGETTTQLNFDYHSKVLKKLISLG
jgi:hypothetical protein